MGEHCKKETFTARLLLYVYVAYPHPKPPSPTPKKLTGSASISGMVSGKSAVHPVVTPYMQTVACFLIAFIRNFHVHD